MSSKIASFSACYLTNGDYIRYLHKKLTRENKKIAEVKELKCFQFRLKQCRLHCNPTKYFHAGSRNFQCKEFKQPRQGLFIALVETAWTFYMILYVTKLIFPNCIKFSRNFPCNKTSLIQFNFIKMDPKFGGSSEPRCFASFIRKPF